MRSEISTFGVRKVIVLAFLLVFAITACSGDKDSKQTDAGKERGNGNAREFGRPDFGQPEEPANIRGLVNSIVGNEITVSKIERFQSNKDSKRKEKSSDESVSDSKKATLGIGSSSLGKGMGGGMKGGGSLDEDVKEQILEKMKKMASGEETFLIPVGIQMLKPEEGRDMREPSMVEATLEDIKKDTMIQVWLDESIKDRQVAKFVLIIN